jgi:predicted MFS family arabinose efflux permease
VIMAHTLGMFGLSNLTGKFSQRCGPVWVVGAGSVVLAISAILTPVSNGVPMLAFSLFLLGLGWDFCFIAGSSLLSSSLASHERGRAQGAGEALVAAAAGAGSLGTGAVFAEAGILAVCGVGVVVSVLLGVVTVVARRLGIED